MAFMMPVMKNEFDIYKSRSRHTSECSQAHPPSTACRSRKTSECNPSGHQATSPGGDMHPGSPAHRSAPMQMQRLASQNMSRNSSRTSQSSLITSPVKSPPKPTTAGSSGSLNKFHTRLVDKLRKSLRKSRSVDRS